MEHKSWPWKKKSTEKTMIAADRVNRGNEDEAILDDKAEVERNLEISNEKLSAALAEINAKDEIAKKQTNIAREAIAGWEKAETEVLSLKQELEKATQQRVSSEERLDGVDAALKECMQQLRFVREEQEKRIHDAVLKTSREYEKARIILEEKLAESNKRLSKLSSENAQLSKALLAKEKMIDELHANRAQVDSDLSAVMSRLESTQRENASLSYEVRVLEKELEIRNEERDFNRRTAEVAHKQHLESVKKIAKLEAEAQRLRLLVRKRLPGPAALAKMKNEVEMLGRDPATRRRGSNPFPIASKDFYVDHASETSSKRINLLTEQLCALEEENRVLKEFLSEKASELSKSQTATGPSRSPVPSHEISMAASSSDMGSDEKVSIAESWTPSCKTVGASDIGLMDDFVEMEKLAIVSVDKPFASSGLALEKHSDWLDNVLKLVSEHARTSQRNSTDILEDIKIALAGESNKDLDKSLGLRDANGYISEEMQTPEKPLDKGPSDELLSYQIQPTKLSNKELHPDMNESIQRLVELIKGIRLSGKDDSLAPYKASDTSTGYTVRVFQWKTSELGAVLETFLQSCTSLLSGKADMEDFAKELTSALEWIMNHCFSLQDVSSMRDEIKKHFDWDETRSESEVEGGIINRLSDADKLNLHKDQFSCLSMASSLNARSNLFQMGEQQPKGKEECRRLKEDLGNMESTKKDLEDRLQSEISKSESLIFQLQESEKTIGNLQAEVETLKEQKGMIEDQIDEVMMVKEDLDKQLIEALGDYDEAPKKSTSGEQENITTSEAQERSICVGEQENVTTNEEAETRNLDQDLLPESGTEKSKEKCDSDHDDEQRLRSEQEITAASEKLAECQETILNIGKQLKALASPRQESLRDKLVSNPASEITTARSLSKNNNQRVSLLEKMMAEDAAGATRSPQAKEVTRTLTSPAILDGSSNQFISPPRFLSVNGIKHQEEEEELVNFLSIVPSKKKSSGGLLKKLLWRKKKGDKK